jgi:phytoene synthase
MRRNILISLGFVLSIGSSEAFVAPQFGRPFETYLSVSVGSSSAASSSRAEHTGGRSKDEIEKELSSGRVLEGGQIIDFSAVKGPSRAEQALLDARLVQSHPHHGVPSNNAILGINDEVIDEVGHELGVYADATDVQRCAAYLRSLAPAGLFETKATVATLSSVPPDVKASLNSLLNKAYEESGEVTGAFAKTFYMGTQLLNEGARRAIWAIYVWCRRTDEIVDAPRDDDDEMLYDLSRWEMRLENLWKYGEVEDVFDLCLLDVRINYPNLPITPFLDMIRGMLMDVPDLGQERYDNFDELHLYCYRVAGTVGLMSMPIFGCASGFTEVEAK